LPIKNLSLFLDILKKSDQLFFYSFIFNEIVLTLDQGFESDFASGLEIELTCFRQLFDHDFQTLSLDFGIWCIPLNIYQFVKVNSAIMLNTLEIE